jgi:glyoxylase I family protein
MFKRIDHVEILPSDIERTISFYTDVLGFTVKERFPVQAPGLREVVFLTLGDTMLELLGATNPTTPPVCTSPVGYTRLALEVDDMDKAVEYLKGKGVEISWGPMDLGDSKRAEILDPDCLSIELRQW